MQANFVKGKDMNKSCLECGREGLRQNQQNGKVIRTLY